MPGVGHKSVNIRHRRQVTLLQLSETIEPQLKRHQTHQEKQNQKMGNVPDHAESFDNESTMEDTNIPKQEEEEEKENQDPEQEPEQTRGNNLMYHLFSYRQQLGYKKHHVMKMVTSKLLLTEELLKLQPIKHSINTNPTSSWEDDFEISLLSDDDDDDDDDELELNNDPLVTELTHLRNYRKYLRNLIVDVATEKLKKCNKKKLKRLKRRTLISSKKPSKKKKGNMDYENWEQNQQDPPSEQNQEEPAEVIVID